MCLGPGYEMRMGGGCCKKFKQPMSLHAAAAFRPSHTRRTMLKEELETGVRQKFATLCTSNHHEDDYVTPRPPRAMLSGRGTAAQAWHGKLDLGVANILSFCGGGPSHTPTLTWGVRVPTSASYASLPQCSWGCKFLSFTCPQLLSQHVSPSVRHRLPHPDNWRAGFDPMLSAWALSMSMSSPQGPGSHKQGSCRGLPTERATHGRRFSVKLSHCMPWELPRRHARLPFFHPWDFSCGSPTTITCPLSDLAARA
jgi:hypothetical protein